MKWGIETVFCAVILAFCISGNIDVQAAAYQIIAAETPMGSGGGQGIRRYMVYDTHGAIVQLTPIPGNLVNDPAGLALRNETELFVSNRAAHSGNSSITRFDLIGSQFAYRDTITGNYVTDCHQAAFDSITDELFQTNWASGYLSRFIINGDGDAIANGYVNMPDSKRMLGVAIRPSTQHLFVSDYDYVRQFSRNPEGTYTHIGNPIQQPNSLLHFMKFHNDELYLASFNMNSVLRYTFDAQGVPIWKESITAPGAVDMAFSPDGQEMFVTDHRNGGINRYRYDEDNDTWVQFGDMLPTPMLGGIVITSTVCPLRADLTGDCIVDYADLAEFVGQWLLSVDPYYCTLSADLEGEECVVQLEDFASFAAQWMARIP